MKYDKNHDTFGNYASVPIGSTVVAQQEDAGPWNHITVVGKGDQNHNNRSYTIHITRQENL